MPCQASNSWHVGKLASRFISCVHLPKQNFLANHTLRVDDTIKFEDLDSESWLSVIFAISPQKNLGNNLSSLVQNWKNLRRYFMLIWLIYVCMLLPLAIYQLSVSAFGSLQPDVSDLGLFRSHPWIHKCSCAALFESGIFLSKHTHPVGLWAWQKYCGSFFVSLLPTEWGNHILLSWCIAEGSSVFQDWQHLRCATQNHYINVWKKDGWQNSGDQWIVTSYRSKDSRLWRYCKFIYQKSQRNWWIKSEWLNWSEKIKELSSPRQWCREDKG